MARKHVFVIAEVSGNHNLDFDRAMQHVKVAAECGADAVKFQTYEADEIAAFGITIPRGYDADHDNWLASMGVTELRELLSKGGLPREWHHDLFAYAAELGIEFMSTPFSVDAARFLVDEVGVDTVKVASGDLTFAPLLSYLNDCPDVSMIMSTGGANLEEISVTVEQELWNRSPANTAILHCVSCYPCPPEDANLAAIGLLKHCFANEVGYSDHTLSTDFVPAMAVALGATILEKHFRVDMTTTIDSAHSVGPNGLSRYVRRVRYAEVLMGSWLKRCHPSEAHDRLWARRSPRDWLRPTDAARQGQWQY